MSLNRDCTVHISGLKEQRNIVIQVDLSDFHDLIISKTKYQIEFVFAQNCQKQATQYGR